MKRGARVLLGALGVGCLSSGRGYPLHGVEPPPPPEEVARLSGYVRSIDGKDVTRLAKAFELLPGCHLVQTPETWGFSEGTQGAVTVTTGEQVFALLLKPGHHYVIEVQLRQMTGPDGVAFLRAREWTADGDLSAEFGPATSEAEIAECLRVGTREPSRRRDGFH